MKQHLFLTPALIYLFLITSCSENKPQTIAQINQVVKVEMKDSSNIGNAPPVASIIDMNPSPEFEIEANTYSSPNYFNFIGKIGNKLVEIALRAYNSPDLTGGYVYTESGTFKKLTGHYQTLDTIHLWNKNQDSVIEHIKIYQTSIKSYTGISVQGIDTLSIELEKNQFTPSQSQFLINEYSLPLSLTKSGIGLNHEKLNSTLFNTSYHQSVSEEGFDTGEELTTNIHKAYTTSDGFKIIAAEIVNNTSLNDFTSQVTIKVDLIKDGTKTSKEIQFTSEEDTLQLYTFNEYLILIGDRTKKMKIFKWNALVMNYEVI